MAANTEMPRAEASTLNARFEVVSDAALELELKENGSVGSGDLPEIVKAASGAFTTGDATDEADSIAALALDMEEEGKADNASPPPQSDIRSLMLRVEALAKKAEAMRLAQDEDAAIPDSSANAIEDQDASATAEPDDQISAVA